MKEESKAIREVGMERWEKEEKEKVWKRKKGLDVKAWKGTSLLSRKLAFLKPWNRKNR